MREGAGPPVLIGVAGGSGSGKSTVVRRLADGIGVDRVAVLHHDAYYRDRSHLPAAERAAINYDHPDALETELLVAHVEDLLGGRPAEIPIYDFEAHVRSRATRRVDPRPVIVLEGMLVLSDPALRELMQLKLFVDADADIRLVRRLRRDMAERGRTAESVLAQYLATVQPMHLDFVEPSKRHADVIIPRGGHNRVAVDLVVAMVRNLVG